MNNLGSFLQAVRDRRPLVCHITNAVTICDCAQVVKSFGGSPVMAYAPEETGDLATLSAALVLNTGTLTSEIIASMKIALRAANQKEIPVILDVCGAGATSFRDRKNLELLEGGRISVLKGNRSEIARMAGLEVQTKGVDAGPVDHDLCGIARRLARERRCTVVITGQEDIVADESKMFLVRNGHEMMAHLVGTGCMAASVIGTFVGASPEKVTEAAAAGLACYEIAAELAARESGGPGSLRQHLLDRIYRLRGEEIDSLQRVVSCPPDLP